jgi:raffinose/stachyose/melibiose transport system permease protein
MVSTLTPSAVDTSRTAERPRRRRSNPYPLWFFAIPAVLFVVLFAIPTFSSFYFSLTRWTLQTTQFIGLENFVLFFNEPTLVSGFIHTFIYAFLTSGAKVVLGILLARVLTSHIIGRGYLRSVVFFPVLVSTIGVGLTFKILMDPFNGLINKSLAVIGITGPGWLTDPNIALYSVILVDIWKGVGIATLIFIAGMVGIPQEYYEAAKVDGSSNRQMFFNITLPLLKPATITVVTLSLIGGLRSFDLIWAMTKGGPGFTSDVIASVIYKQYQAGFYGLSTAGNVVLFLVVTAIIVPMSIFLNRPEAKR